MLVLTHFKGHTMGGFGGSMKNIAIGCASGKVGKMQLHQKGDNMWGFTGERFMEHMGESAKAIVDHFGPRITYINVMRNMSVDCDCAGTSAAPVVTPDIGNASTSSSPFKDSQCVAVPPNTRARLVFKAPGRILFHRRAPVGALTVAAAIFLRCRCYTAHP